MGDRVSIRFVTPDAPEGMRESVTLFDHWGGMGRVNHALAYAKALVAECGAAQCYPIERLEPNTVMVDYIRTLTREEYGTERVKSCYYLGTSPDDGDNSDNGHHDIVLRKRKQAVGPGERVAREEENV